MANKELKKLDVSDGAEPGHMLPPVVDEFGSEGVKESELDAYKKARASSFKKAFEDQRRKEAEKAIEATGLDPEVFRKVSETALAGVTDDSSQTGWNKFTNTVEPPKGVDDYPNGFEGTKPNINAPTAEELVGASASTLHRKPEE